MSEYDKRFFESIEGGSVRSAGALVPYVLELVAARSVVDVGCGNGTWAAEFIKAGVPEVLGLDGTWVHPEQLLIPREQFRAHDLANVPVRLDRTFDLAICLEVGEHLPDAQSDRLVDDLCRLAPVVLFSAAVPGQGGTSHINEQWPGYWIERFRRAGRRAIDCVRPVFWNDGRVQWWYRQNAIVYATDAALAAHPKLARAAAESPKDILAMVHPEGFAEITSRRPGLKAAAAAVPDALARAVKQRLSKTSP
jgi:SAM-dependent methyltransferase